MFLWFSISLICFKHLFTNLKSWRRKNQRKKLIFTKFCTFKKKDPFFVQKRDKIVLPEMHIYYNLKTQKTTIQGPNVGNPHASHTYLGALQMLLFYTVLHSLCPAWCGENVKATFLWLYPTILKPFQKHIETYSVHFQTTMFPAWCGENMQAAFCG